VSERLVTILEHLGTSSLIFIPTAEDFRVPELEPLLDLYGRGKDFSSVDRAKLCRLAWELTGDSFGGRQQLYERLHSGDPATIIAAVYQRYDKTNAVDIVKRLLESSGS
jgi:4-hydroxyphenylacetate 3-monooxygenase/anthranilate 3-monooxygenase (FAD)/4-hydroxyphenylacetate 3-monooxygenase